jgi:hypothetical protein
LTQRGFDPRHDDPHRTPRQNGIVLVVATAHRSALPHATVPAIEPISVLDLAGQDVGHGS